MQREELIAAAARHVQDNMGNYRVVGDPVFREAAFVYFRCECEGQPARVQVMIDKESGKCFGYTFYPRDLVASVDEFYKF